MTSMITENADIMNFFESKICKDVVNIIDEFAKPHLFEVGDEIEVKFTWCCDYDENYGNECNYYQISEIYRNKYCSEVYVYETQLGGVSLIYENHEDDSQPKKLFINKDSYGDEYISFAEFERAEEISYELFDYLYEAKDIDR